ncbi:MAG: DUF2628 domain-containing protein [Rhizobiaceae bacterium]|nr:DUF2628 domain-containing protein [Rhizobiaceae bacterium]
MASYLILTPPSGTDRNQDRTRFIRDGFSLAAFVFPALWMLFHRLWLHAAAAFLLQAAAIELLRRPGYLAAGVAILLAVHLLAALEGRYAFQQNLIGSGWRMTALISADSLATAEEMYFLDRTSEAKEDIHPKNWDIPSYPTNSSHGGPSFGLPGYDGGR